MISLICFLISSLSFARPSTGFVTYDKNDPQKFYDPWGAPLKVMGINRFAIYEAEDNRDNMTMEEYFKFLKSHGFNLIRVFIREGFNPEGTRPLREPIEIELGKYSERYPYDGIDVKAGEYSSKGEYLGPNGGTGIYLKGDHLEDELDELFRLANKHQIYIILNIFNHYYLHHAWGEAPKINGKRVRPTPYYEKGYTSDRFYTSPLTRPFQIKRVKKIVTRYKNEKYLFAWEPMNEVNGALKNYKVEEQKIVIDWYEAMAREIKKIDPHHLITISTTPDIYWKGGILFGKYRPWKSLYKSKYTDIIQIHCYGMEAGYLYFKYRYKLYIKEAKKYNKPVMIGEFAIIKGTPFLKSKVKKALEIAKEENIPALYWTHKFDPLGYGGLSDDVLEVYKEVYNL